MKKISYEVKIKFEVEVEVDDEFSDDNCIEQMKDDLECNLCRSSEVEFGLDHVKEFEVEHINA